MVVELSCLLVRKLDCVVGWFSYLIKFLYTVHCRAVANGQAIAGDATRRRDNLTTKVGPEAALGGQLTLKDDWDAKITKGPKMKEKKLKSDKPEPSEEA